MTIWRAGLPLVAQRPWFGYGPETTRAVFATVYPPQLVYYQGRDVVVDRAHNLWLDLALPAGAAGVVTLGALLAATGRQVWRGCCSAWRRRWRQPKCQFNAKTPRR
jgi:O-antigen ligase